MRPMLAMKSSTLSSLSVLVVTFLNASPAFFPPGAGWPCTAARPTHANPISHANRNAATASVHR